MYVYIYIYIYRERERGVCIYIYIYTDIHTYIPTYLPTYIHTYIHTYITYIHTYIYIYIYKLSQITLNQLIHERVSLSTEPAFSLFNVRWRMQFSNAGPRLWEGELRGTTATSNQTPSWNSPPRQTQLHSGAKDLASPIPQGGKVGQQAARDSIHRHELRSRRACIRAARHTEALNPQRVC